MVGFQSPPLTEGLLPMLPGASGSRRSPWRASISFSRSMCRRPGWPVSTMSAPAAMASMLAIGTLTLDPQRGHRMTFPPS